MSNYRLTKRMAALADFVLPGQPAADIGTDHGFVPIYLLAENRIPSAILTDIRQGPLDIAKGNLARFKIDENRADLRLGSGLVPLKSGEVSSVVIAGMGGEMIIDILAADIDKSRSFKRFILQPRKDSFLLRGWIYENKFLLTNQILVEEDGNICEIMTAEPTDTEPERDDIYLPKAIQSDPLFQPFLAEYIRRLQVVIDNIKKKNDDELLAPWMKRMDDAEKLRKDKIYEKS